MKNIFNQNAGFKKDFFFLKDTLFVFLFLISVSYPQIHPLPQINPLSSIYRFSISGGVSYTKTDFRLSEIDYLLKGEFGYLFETSSNLIFGTKLFAASGFLKGNGESASKLSQIESFRTNVWYVGGGVTLNYSILEFFVPFISAGAAYINYRPLLKNIYDMETGVKNNSAFENVMVYGEGGFLMMVSKNLGFSFTAEINYVPADDLDGVTNIISNGNSDDLFVSGLFGINLFIGGTIDSDGDGIPDKLDACPNTPVSVAVDQFGCPVDSDKDGIPDYIDLCNNTPINTFVDSLGSPLDSDDDGIPDFRDLCTGTAAGIEVDSSGCPLDSDKDGVADYIDLCPDTPAGNEVDKDGCIKSSGALLIPEKYLFILQSDLSFDGDFNLLPFAQAELWKIINIMRDYSATKWRIESYTDNAGSYESNIDLSINRAKAIYEFIVSAGIKPDRLAFFGYGAEYPIADNSSEAGRSRNRRIVILLDLAPASEEAASEQSTSLKYNYADEKYAGEMIYSDGYLYCIQLSSWRNEKIANDEAKNLLSKGFDSFVAIVELPDGGGIWYRVRVGYFTSLKEAQIIKKQILK